MGQTVVLYKTFQKLDVILHMKTKLTACAPVTSIASNMASMLR